MDSLYRLYKSSTDYKLWPILEAKFTDILYGKEDTDVETTVTTEKIDGKVVGFISIKRKIVNETSKGSIALLFIDDEYRQTDIAHKLLQKAITWFKLKGTLRIKFGGSNGSYFWPALPENLPFIKNTLSKEGFIISDGPVDMFGDTSSFTPLPNVYRALTENNVVIEYSNEKYIESILEFTNEHFHHWHEYYKKELLNGNFEKVFFAHRNNEIIAVSMLWVGNSNWDLLFENNVGGGGALGVSEKWRGKGIGLAMKTWGTEILKRKGVKYVWISWTSSIDFYKKMGFEIWRKYNNARLEI